MARYIDVDYLNARIMSWGESRNQLKFAKDLCELIDLFPAADVVPRAELAVTSFRQAARIAALTDEVKMLEAAIAAEIGEKLRGEIVREIFEEIKTCLEYEYMSYLKAYDYTLLTRIEELEKKYTEK